MSSANVPFFRGKDVVFKFYQDGTPVYMAAKNWNVDENATEVADGVNGEDRDRLDKVTNYYSASVDIYQSDQVVMQSIIDAQATDDLNDLPLNQTAMITIRHRDGTKAAYKMTGVKAGPFGVSQTGRSDAVMLNVKMRFRYWDPMPTFGG